MRGEAAKQYLIKNLRAVPDAEDDSLWIRITVQERIRGETLDTRGVSELISAMSCMRSSVNQMFRDHMRILRSLKADGH